MKPAHGLFQLFLAAALIIGSITVSNAQTSGGGHTTFTTNVDITATLSVGGDINTSTTSVVNLNELNVGGKSIFNGLMKAPGLSNGTGYQPVYIGPDGQIVTANGIGGPLFPSTACNPVNPAWHIGGTTFGGMGLSDPSVGTCDDYVFGLKSNNTVRIWLTGSTYNGNIGFGTPTPSERFHFYGGNILLDRESVTLTNELFKIKLNSNSIKAFNVSNTSILMAGVDHFAVYGDGKTNVGYQPNSTNAAKLNVNVDGDEAFNVFNEANDKITVAFKANGNAYFGGQRIKPTHLHTDANFQFDGKVGCKELVVVDPSKWADFVFDPAYKLPALSEVEAYYRAHKHLKDVPSEKEVKENGINAADMYATLLQKIEELTIYTVDLNKKMEQLAEENKQLKKHLEKK